MRFTVTVILIIICVSSAAAQCVGPNCHVIGSGDVFENGTQISWTSVEGTWQNCNLLTSTCGNLIPLPDTDFPPGTWTMN